jgi:D-alanyl-D-alanine carboxypeptidase
MKKKKMLLIVIPILLVVSYLAVFFIFHKDAKAPTAIEDSVTTKPIVEEPIVYPVILTNEQATSLTVVVNKKHRLPEDYVPSTVSVAGGYMRQEAATELQKLLDDASGEGVNLKIISSYRSYNTQVSTYNGWVAQYGQEQADTFSARPGFSEHQTGLAVDLGNSDGSCALEICFGATTGGQWIAKHAVEYGFFIRYPEGKDALTGYEYEPWHLRFVGVDLAKSIVNSDKTLDQYYGVEAGGY